MLYQKGTRLSLTASLLLLSGLSTAHAEGETYLGLAWKSDYVVASVSQNDGKPALQGYVEHAFANGIYAGAWLSQVDYSEYGLKDDVETDLYIGYRGELGKLSYDFGYYRYYYDDIGYDYDEVIVDSEYAFTERFAGGIKLRSAYGGIYEHEQQIGGHLRFALAEATSIDAELMGNTADHNRDWNIGLRQQFDETVSVEIRYYDANFTDGILTAGLSWDTDFSTLTGK